jgi:hypothetical protein
VELGAAPEALRRRLDAALAAPMVPVLVEVPASRARRSAGAGRAAAAVQALALWVALWLLLP